MRPKKSARRTRSQKTSPSDWMSKKITSRRISHSASVESTDPCPSNRPQRSSQRWAQSSGGCASRGGSVRTEWSQSAAGWCILQMAIAPMSSAAPPPITPPTCTRAQPQREFRGFAAQRGDWLWSAYGRPRRVGAEDGRYGEHVHGGEEGEGRHHAEPDPEDRPQPVQPEEDTKHQLARALNAQPSAAGRGGGGGGGGGRRTGMPSERTAVPMYIVPCRHKPRPIVSTAASGIRGRWSWAAPGAAAHRIEVLRRQQQPRDVSSADSGGGGAQAARRRGPGRGRERGGGPTDHMSTGA
eukprot:COSAG04_NODE_812_length_10107_cov_2.942946_3_plen_297_part_00